MQSLLSIGPILTLKPVPGPTTYPNNNHLSYLKVSSGTLKSVPDSSLPPLAAEIVDGGVSLREETLPSGEKWLKGEAVVLLR